MGNRKVLIMDTGYGILRVQCPSSFSSVEGEGWVGTSCRGKGIWICLNVVLVDRRNVNPADLPLHRLGNRLVAIGKFVLHFRGAGLGEETPPHPKLNLESGQELDDKTCSPPRD
jgi:hypothetical protein